MNPDKELYDYQRHAILFVDDEANSRKYFQRLFGRKFRILEAADGVEALEIFRTHASEIGIVVTDQRMPNETGVGFLSKIAPSHPDVIKILSTAYTDIDAAIGSVNHGGIFRYITKPWDIPELEITLRRAMEFYIVKRERDSLLSTKMLAFGNILLANRLAAFAFVPVCSATPSAHAAEAIAAFIRIAISSANFASSPENTTSTPDLGKLHASQIGLAGILELRLPEALGKDGLSTRIQALCEMLAAAGAAGVSMDDGGTAISADSDPTPDLLHAVLGSETDPETANRAMSVMAAFMAIYDSGYTISRDRSQTLRLEVLPRTGKPETDPGSETAKWLVGDEMLVSAALGIL